MRRSIPPLCIAIVSLVIVVQSVRQRHEGQAQHGPAPAPPCSDQQRALVDGLDEGQLLGDYRVMRFRCADARVMEIDLRRDTTPLVLIVAEPGAVPHTAPRQTDGHDLFYNKQTAANEPPTQKEIDALLELLSKRVEAAEKK